jgi:uncharacterized membrane protein (UPF0127 family)
MKLKVGDKEFTVKVASTPEQRAKGLSTVKAGSMPENAGLVLKFDTPTVANITMKEMKFPLDLVFISGDKVQKIISAEPGQENITIGKESDSVLETPIDSSQGIKPGDPVEWIGEKLEDGTIQKADGGVIAHEDAMHVLDENGKVQANIEGDERIFSRKHTARLCELAECAHTSKSDNDYKKLGMAMMRMIDKQDTQEQEYTDN